MGYLSRVSGAIRISPPLQLSEFHDSPFIMGADGNHDYDVCFDERMDSHFEGDKLVITSEAVSIIARHNEPAKYYELGAYIQQVVDAYPDREFTGWLVRVGDEPGDIERYGVRDGRVVTEKPVMRWPDGTDVVAEAGELR